MPKEIARREFIAQLGSSFAVLTYSQLLRAGAFAPSKSLELGRIKKDLEILSHRPFNAQTPVHLLDDEVTPRERMFVRNNGLIPSSAMTVDSKWRLELTGEIKHPLSLRLEDLKRRFKKHTLQLVLECGGNGRAGFVPPTKGNQWTYGAVACPMWGGVRLKDVLDAAGLKQSAVFVAYYGDDMHLSGDYKRDVISRGVSIAKALDPTSLIAFEMNGEPLAPEHGFPARLLIPGYPGSVSGKWLRRIWVRDRIHDGAKMLGYSYRVPKHPVAPGSKVSEEEMEIIKEMPVKSIITSPRSAQEHSHKESLRLRGFAWSGGGDIKAQDLSIDFGASWQKASLEVPRNRFAWQRWRADVKFPGPGYYEVWARATDQSGAMQPMVVGPWNPKGYLNNAMQRIAVHVI